MRRIRKWFRETDNIILLLIGVGIGWALVVFGPAALDRLGPRTIPLFERSILCENVGPPMGGNHRSLLALRGNDRQNLNLEVKLGAEEITLGNDFEVQIVFMNEDIGPITLYLPETDPVIGTSEANVGISLEIENVVTRLVSQDNRTANPPPTTFDPDEIHLLKSHSSCSVMVTLDSSTLNALGLGQGEYNIRAVYRNTQRGVTPPSDNPATPVLFGDQGVWVGTTRSDAVRFVILPPATPTSPAP